MLRILAIGFAMVAAISFSGSDASAEGPQLVITDAIANLTTPATILIEGQEFRPAGLRDPNPLVFIGGAGGILQPLEIVNATNTAIMARLAGLRREPTIWLSTRGTAARKTKTGIQVRSLPSMSLWVRSA